VSPRPIPYQALIRRNLRRLRTKFGLRQEDLALGARARGLRWSASTVTAIEIGRRPISAGELLLLPTLLQVPLTELVSGDQDEVADVDGVLVTMAAMDQIGHGLALTELESVFFVTPPIVEMGATDAERKAAKSLSKATNSTISVRDLFATAQLLWEGRRLDEERDRRLKATPGQGNLARRRGHITGLLQQELLEELRPPKAQVAHKADTSKGRDGGSQAPLSARRVREKKQ
jgi:transcriptional regulator with XRE-family HTH domain